MYFNQILWHTLAPQAAYIISVVAGFIKWVMDIPGYSAVGLTTHKPYLSPIYVGNLQRRRTALNRMQTATSLSKLVPPAVNRSPGVSPRLDWQPAGICKLPHREIRIIKFIFAGGQHGAGCC